MRFLHRLGKKLAPKLPGFWVLFRRLFTFLASMLHCRILENDFETRADNADKTNKTSGRKSGKAFQGFFFMPTKSRAD